MTKGFIILCRLKSYQIEIDGKTHTFSNDIAIGVYDTSNNNHCFVGTVYTPLLEEDNYTENGAVSWTREEFEENVDSWSVIK